MKYRIWFTSFWYAPEEEFLKFEEALEFARKKGFDCSIQRMLPGQDWNAIGHWSIITGYRKF